MEALSGWQSNNLVSMGIEYFVVAPRTMEWAAAVRLRLKMRARRRPCRHAAGGAAPGGATNVFAFPAMESFVFRG
jgi:hypothetical protein